MAKKLKAPALDPNLTQGDIEVLIKNIGDNGRAVDAIQADLDKRVAKLQQDAGVIIADFHDKLAAAEAIVRAWAEANRDRLCRDGQKTAKLATGTLVWRLSPKKVSVKKADEVIERLKELRLRAFIRIKETVDKEAILAASPKKARTLLAIKGIGITQTETLEIQPATAQHQSAANGKAVK